MGVFLKLGQLERRKALGSRSLLLVAKSNKLCGFKGLTCMDHRSLVRHNASTKPFIVYVSATGTLFVKEDRATQSFLPRMSAQAVSMFVP